MKINFTWDLQMESHCLILISVCFGILMRHIPKSERVSLILLTFFSTRIWNAAFLKEIQNNFSYLPFNSVLKLSYCLISDFSRKDNIVLCMHTPSLSVHFSFIVSDHVKNFSSGTSLSESLGTVYTENYYTTYCSSLWNADVEGLCCRW